MIEANEIFEQIKQDSQTIGQVITETKYIVNELKDYVDIYARANERCTECGNNMQFIEDKKKELKYLQCQSCGYIEGRK